MSPDDIYLIAEPALSELIDAYGTVDTLNMQQMYENATGLNSYPQASVFVKSTMSDLKFDMVMSDISDAIDAITDDENILYTKHLLDTDLSIITLMQSIEQSNLLFVSSQDAKSDIEAYFQIILDTNPQLIGGQLPENDFYR